MEVDFIIRKVVEGWCAEKAAFITGGARGIGRATALLFAKQGARVGIVDLKKDGLEETSAKAKQMGYELKSFVGDVTQKDNITKVMDEFVLEFGRIDILVNNAGIVIPKPFLEKTAEDWEKTLAVNVIGLFLCCQAAAKYMLNQKSGKIVNISSIRGIVS